jgi:hypothetical protein
MIDLVLGNWELALLIATWSAIGIVSIRRRIEWRQRRFTQQVNFSLTIPVERDGSQTLLLRTLLEEGAANVWLNEFGVSRVLKAARLTTREMPFLRITQSNDRDLVMNAVLNVLSERFSDAFVARAVGLSIKTDIFLFGLTWERYGEMKTQKLRVILIKRTDLQSLFEEGFGNPEIGVVEESHRPRIETLRCMFELSTSSNHEERDMIREVELGIATHGVPPRVEPG